MLRVVGVPASFKHVFEEFKDEFTKPSYGSFTHIFVPISNVVLKSGMRKLLIERYLSKSAGKKLKSVGDKGFMEKDQVNHDRHEKIGIRFLQ